MASRWWAWRARISFRPRRGQHFAMGSGNCWWNSENSKLVSEQRSVLGNERWRRWDMGCRYSGLGKSASQGRVSRNDVSFQTNQTGSCWCFNSLSSIGISLIGASIAQPLLKQFASISPALADIGFGGVGLKLIPVKRSLIYMQVMFVQQSLGITVIGAVPKVNGTKLKTITAPLTKPFGGILSGGSILNFGGGSASYTDYPSCMSNACGRSKISSV